MDEQLINDESAIENGATENEVTEYPEEENITNGPEAEDDYAALAESDLKVLKESFRELKDLRELSELDDPMKFARLRDLGYSAVEAYLECSQKRKARDNRSHLHSSVPISRARDTSSMSREELEIARELFDDLSDADIQKLYKSVVTG